MGNLRARYAGIHGESMTLQAYYPLDEANGDAQDYSGNGNTGTLNGATQDVTGILGTSAYDFNGSSDYVNINGVPHGSTGITLSVWFNSDDINSSTTQTPLSLYLNNRTRIINGNGDISFFISDGTDNYNVIYSGGSSNVWHHVVGTWNGGTDTMKLYVDGIERDSTSGVTSIDQFGTNDRIGNREVGSGEEDFFDGTIGEARVYDHALTAGEVQYLYEVSQSANFTTEKRLL